jgi:hypothetical protein
VKTDETELVTLENIETVFDEQDNVQLIVLTAPKLDVFVKVERF